MMDAERKVKMRAKPVPKKEIMIEVASAVPGHGAIVWIWTASGDASAFVEEEAPQFGSLAKPWEYELNYTLFVGPNYDWQEVVQYLDSYNEKLDA